MKSIDKQPRWVKWTAAGTVALGVTGLTGCSSAEKPTTPIRTGQTTSETSPPTSTTTPSTGETSPNTTTVALPEALKPENLVDKTPEEITQLFRDNLASLKLEKGESTQKFAEAFAVRLLQNNGGLYMAGCDKLELDQFRDAGKGEYEAAMANKYTSAITLGTFGKAASTGGDWLKKQEEVSNRCFTTYMAKISNSSIADYNYDISLVLNTVKVTGSLDDGTLAFSFVSHETDNMPTDQIESQTGLSIPPYNLKTAWNIEDIHYNPDTGYAFHATTSPADV